MLTPEPSHDTPNPNPRARRLALGFIIAMSSLLVAAILISLFDSQNRGSAQNLPEQLPTELNPSMASEPAGKFSDFVDAQQNIDELIGTATASNRTTNGPSAAKLPGYARERDPKMCYADQPPSDEEAQLSRQRSKDNPLGLE